ncbi:hypothetical protein HPB48_001144 [Haemaphysalis longicornis]|uniref:Uncharacterized protein n=1 Tax=Haemaphysalis longicornis TaxID=44386 RepID=A0A9J6FIV5_HAELO|nr:hypothetical protein HPB48_001144 [Haemaphysalis longicornis]
MNLSRAWLLSAAEVNYDELKRLLLEDPDLYRLKDFTSGYTALHWAAKFGNSEIRIIDQLFTYGADINIRDHSGRKPTQYLKGGVPLPIGKSVADTSRSHQGAPLTPAKQRHEKIEEDHYFSRHPTPCTEAQGVGFRRLRLSAEHGPPRGRVHESTGKKSAPAVEIPQS